MDIPKKVQEEPDFSKAVDVKAFLQNELGLCGCFEWEPALDKLRWLLSWVNETKRERYHTLFGGDLGVYYLLMGALDRADLEEHGTSVRYPFLSEKGVALKRALDTFSNEQIENAWGDCYDGLYIPEPEVEE